MNSLSAHSIKNVILCSLSLCIIHSISSQNEVVLRTNGIVIPRTNILSINNPDIGMISFDTLIGHQMFYNGTEWIRLVGGNEPGLIQTLSKSGGVVTLSEGGGSFLDQVQDGDGQPTNELQTISKSGSTISLSLGGGSITDSDDWLNNGSDISYTNGKVGIGEVNPEGYLHIKADDNLAEPHLKITDQGSDAFVRIELNREGINKLWFHSATTNATDASSYYSFIYEDGGGALIPLIRMDGMGRVGIGRFPTGNRFEVSGPASKSVAGDWVANSDKRIKTDIREIENSFDILEILRPVKFKYTEEWKTRNPSIKDQYYYNFIAQEYQEVFPTSVNGSGEYLENDDQEILQIDTYNAQIATIAAVKELIKENTELREALENQRSQLQFQIDELKALLENTSEVNKDFESLHIQLKESGNK